MMRTIVLMVLLLPGIAAAQLAPDAEELNKCGDERLSAWTAYYGLAAENWGYGYAALLADLERWKTSPYVRVDSVGASKLGRALYVMTVQGIQPANRTRVWIHARTHPNEVQGTYVTNEIINILLSETPLGRRLRDSCIFNIMPMYNPDGVELGWNRLNADSVDIESNWGKPESVTQPEVKVLRSVFTSLMGSFEPIKVALNMHSAYECHRFFWYHAATGTSAAYAAMQQRFINAVVGNFPEGMQGWNTHVSWTTTAATQYPESWFWYNHGDRVLALTYEDMNCPSNGQYDRTGYAIARGIAAYLNIDAGLTSVADRPTVAENEGLAQNFPNPFNPSTLLRYRLAEGAHATLRIYDILGREVAILTDGWQSAGEHVVRWNAAGRAAGVYIAVLRAGAELTTRRLVYQK